MILKTTAADKASEELKALGVRLDLSAPLWNKETSHFDYSATLSHGTVSMTFCYHTGSGWKQSDGTIQRPTLADIMQSLMLDAMAGQYKFEEWASEYGYDEDSRKAFKIYEECLRIGNRVYKMLGKDALPKVNAILQDL